MLRLAFDFIITWRETRTRPKAYSSTDKFHSAYLLANMAGAEDSTGIIPVSVSA